MLAIALAATFALGTFMGTPPRTCLLAAIIILGWALIVFVIAAVIRRIRNRALRRVVASAEPGYSGLLLEVELSTPIFAGRGWRPEVFDGALVKAGLRRPIAIVAECLRESMQAIELRHELLEPETIDSSPAFTTRSSIAFAMLCGFNGLTGLNRRSWLPAAIFFTMALIALLRIPEVRRRLPRLRPIDRAPTAGPGYLEDARGRRWTAKDSVLIVAARRASGPVWAMLLGPAGRNTISFTRPDEESFAALWQRWCHPQPRLELLGS